MRIHEPALVHHRNAAMEAEARGDLKTAVHHYGKIITLVPWDAGVRQQLGHLLYQQGDYARALVQYNEALRYDREAVPPRLAIAEILIAQGQPEKARALLESLLPIESAHEQAERLLQTIPNPSDR